MPALTNHLFPDIVSIIIPCLPAAMTGFRPYGYKTGRVSTNDPLMQALEKNGIAVPSRNHEKISRSFLLWKTAGYTTYNLSFISYNTFDSDSVVCQESSCPVCHH
jgi:hypothetical protein